MNKRMLVLSTLTVALSSCGQQQDDLSLQTAKNKEMIVPVYQVVSVGAPQENAQALAEKLGIRLERTEDPTLSYLDEKRFQSIPVKKQRIKPVQDEDGEVKVAESFDLEKLLEMNESRPVIDPKEATEKLLNVLKETELLPNKYIDFKPMTGHSEFEAVDMKGNAISQKPIKLDTQVSLNLTLHESIPYQGPGAKIKMAFDRSGQVTQLYYGLRNLVPTEKVAILSKKVAIQKCAQKFEQVGENIEVNAQLVYYAPSLDQKSERIYPYYECQGSVINKKSKAELKRAYVKATEKAPDIFDKVEEPNQKPGDRRRAMASKNDSQIAPLAIPRTDVGVEWLGRPAGLSGSARNAGGFARTFRDAGYTVQFNWGNYAAWESDFKDPSKGGNDNRYVDDVDAVFYTGHANGNGFTFLSNRHDRFLHYNDARWGNRNLEWLVIAACGPLQSSWSGQRWWQRWGPSFDGLHLLMAYATVSFDNEREGRIYARELLKGKKVRHAWVKAAMRTQPSSVTYAYMGTFGRHGMTNYNDHFWGKGSVGPDIRSKRGYWKVSGPS